MRMRRGEDHQTEEKEKKKKRKRKNKEEMRRRRITKKRKRRIKRKMDEVHQKVGNLLWIQWDESFFSFHSHFFSFLLSSLLLCPLFPILLSSSFFLPPSVSFHYYSILFLFPLLLLLPLLFPLL